ncbi:MAG: D-amino acid dehydrogenase [Devosia sp.]
MKVLILGAGVLGTTTAYYLAREGHEVHVVDRQAEAGMETSRGNGGVLHTSEVEPWSQPGMPQKVLSWIGRNDAPMLLRIGALPSMWQWGVRFMRNCTLDRYRRASELNLRLALLTLEEIKGIREESGVKYDLVQNGSMKIFRSAEELEVARLEADILKPHGLKMNHLSAAECVEREPALGPIEDQLQGGLFAPMDENGDCHKFTAGLRAYIAERYGVTFHFNTSIDKIERSGDRVTGVVTSAGRMTADVYVAALASFSAPLLSPIGVKVDIYPAKGIAVTVPAAAWPDGPKLPVIEISKLFGFIPIGDRYRCSGSVEFNGWNGVPSQERAQAIVNNVISVFPEFAKCYDPETADVWAGLRPMPASGSPYVGKSSLSNLYLNCGHGHLGWTMSCGSSRAVSDLMLGRTPPIALDGISPETHL